MKRRLFRWARLIAGWVLVVAGAITAPTPLPIGWILLIIGFSILVHESETVRGWFRRLRLRYPRVGHWLNRNKHYAPGFAERLVDRTDPHAQDGSQDNHQGSQAAAAQDGGDRHGAADGDGASEPGRQAGNGHWPPGGDGTTRVEPVTVGPQGLDVDREPTPDRAQDQEERPRT